MALVSRPMTDKWQILQALAVPLLGVFGLMNQARQERHTVRLLERLVTVRKDAPATSHKDLDRLIAQLAEAVSYKERRRLSRRLDGASAASLIFVLVVGGLALFGAFSFDAWWSYLIGITIAVFSIILAWVGALDLYMYDPNLKPPAFMEAANSK